MSTAGFHSAHSTRNDAPRRNSWKGRAKTYGITIFRHLRNHAGAGIICSVAYFDPGNWGVDLQAGSQFGYRLLFVVLLAGIFAVFLQTLASRLGCVTGLDLASHCRLLLHDRPKHKLLYRWLALYPLYVLAEIAIIATDLAELLGSAIALVLLFPKLELWHGVLITGVDVIFLLAMGDPLRGKPVRFFETLIAILVLAVMICMLLIVPRIEINWRSTFLGYVPSKYIFSSGGIYTSIGILGATVMPHSIFLGSALATQDRMSLKRPLVESAPEYSQSSESIDKTSSESIVPKPLFARLLSASKDYIVSIFRRPPPSAYATEARRHSDRDNNQLGFVKAHIYHGTVDMVGSLLGFAVLINSVILILASAVFFYGPNGATDGPASLFDAYDLIKEMVGPGAATLFAIALLSAGQSSSIIATVAGQAVAEGFLRWRVSAAMRRIITRLIAMIPSMIVAIAVGRSGVDALLVASQVVLSIVLPFITFPLIYLTSSKKIMRAEIDPISNGASVNAGQGSKDRYVIQERKDINGGSDELQEQRRSMEVHVQLGDKGHTEKTVTTHSKLGGENDDVDVEKIEANPKALDFSNGVVASVIGYGIFLIILGANVYVLVSLGTGSGG